ncbi:ABC transporter ATP-binding protein [Kocuria sp. LUK]|uniref:ABC transporter ATP-binding protein n=1 Tax=Kocuria TaxID=57493 RepID=UPI001E34F623|nr:MULTISPECIES: ABC transporter ATP-binding protein [Kocuria]MCD1145660.1 ABC transporter ATP-binding protein [Kocuria sp. LUK]MCJ8506243.1 ABC transporter ATP-binding protein [Kocuria flava]
MSSPAPPSPDRTPPLPQQGPPPPDRPGGTPALSVRGLVRVFGRPGDPSAKTAVDRVDLDVPRGSFFGLVGRNGAGKTTLLSMATGLLRPTAGTVRVAGADVWREPRRAKQLMGVLPDGVHLFDRLTGRQLVTYSGLLRGMDRATVAERTEDLLRAMDLLGDAGTQVQDYSAGMTKKIALAGALIHAPSLLVLDEPFESVDPVSAANIRAILHGFVDGGGTVVVSSHVMDLVQRMCDHVAVLDRGRVLAAGTVDEVRAGASLEDRFVDLVGGRADGGEGLSWLRPE